MTIEHFKLTQKPDIIELFAKRQISGLQQSIVEALQNKSDTEITQEVLIHNDEYPSYPFRIDIVVGYREGVQVAVEIDGRYHDKPDAIARDKRKTAKMQSMGYNVIRISYSIPRNLVYGHLAGEERGFVKQQYERWRMLWIEQTAQDIIDTYNKLTDV
jgi:very-short-patch-repair endonuclease